MEPDMPHPDASEDELFGMAFYELVHNIVPGIPRDATTQAVIDILSTVPAPTFEQHEHRKLMIKAVMGFGPLGHAAGHA